MILLELSTNHEGVTLRLRLILSNGITFIMQSQFARCTMQEMHDKHRTYLVQACFALRHPQTEDLHGLSATHLQRISLISVCLYV